MKPMSVWKRYRLLALGVIVAGATLAGCTPDFGEASCETDDDCFNDEMCVEGVCRLAVSGGEDDANVEPDTDEDTSVDAGTDTDVGMDADGGGETSGGAVAAVVVTPEAAEVAVGKTTRLQATVLDGEGKSIEPEMIEWSSADESVATVAPAGDDEGGSPVGVVTGEKTGEVMITVEAAGLSATATVEVVETPVYRVTVDSPVVELEVGATKTLSATVYDEESMELTGRTVTWSSTNTDIVTVGMMSGEIEGVKTGTAEIVARSEGVEARASVTVVEKAVDTVEIVPGGAKSVARGETLQLGALPADRRGNPLCTEMEATGTSTPCGRTATWTSGATAIATVDGKGLVTGQKPGTVTIFADVDGAGATREITVTQGNVVPLANAGPDQTARVGDMVQLDGSQSSDPNMGQTLSYQWSFASKPAGSTATLSGPMTAMPSLTVDKEGTYVVDLTVSDGMKSATDSVRIDVTAANQPPVADAGMDQTVTAGATVQLDASGSSDPDVEPLTYTWSFVSRPMGSTATLSNTFIAKPMLMTDVAGTYELQVMVDDGKDTATATVTITATAPNQAPTASAGSDQTVAVGAQATVDASGSTDPEADPLSYTWAFTSKPGSSTATLSSTTAEQPTFTADVAGDYVLEVTVDDGMSTDTDTVTVTGNASPTAATGSDRSVTTGNTVNLDASGSTDPESDPLTYSWAFVSKPGSSTATLSNAGMAQASFQADVTGTYELEVTVDDGTSTATATVTITAN
jgi:uncharacterized protein YjdB